MRIKTIENKAARNAQVLIGSDDNESGGFVVGGITETAKDVFTLAITDPKLTGLEDIAAPTIKEVHAVITAKVKEGGVVYRF